MDDWLLGFLGGLFGGDPLLSCLGSGSNTDLGLSWDLDDNVAFERVAYNDFIESKKPLVLVPDRSELTSEPTLELSL